MSVNIVVLASGNGSNLQAIIDAVSQGRLGCVISAVISDNKNAYALSRAKNAGVEAVVVDPEKFGDKQSFDDELAGVVRSKKAGLIVLAGYMRLLSSEFVSEFAGRIMNIHPALLPSFKGTHGIKDAFDYGVKVTGVTVHFVDEKMDHGPIILQEPVRIEESDTPESLEERIHAAEHRLYTEAIRLFCDGKLKMDGRKVVRKE